MTERTLTGLDRAAVEECLRLVDLAGADDWDRDTPCAGWTLRRLVAHLAAQHRGFAAAAHGEGGDPAHWREPPSGADVAAAHREAAREVIGAFALPGVLEREFTLPEIPRPGPGPDRGWPGHVAVGFHLVDHVVHAWDVAATVGARVELPGPVVAAALDVALRVPAGPGSRGPGAAFAPPVALDGQVTAFERMLAALGRDPRARPGTEPQMFL
ncbi:TIGR03086 family metal-binding protein [Streptomyces sp. NPDC057694]|uniref:TIGR03086 family metal-binding protein n=1 Tax=Streptomyces sp. NPDC057694 TaxID=3346216 RepID=UPI0036C9B451